MSAHYEERMEADLAKIRAKVRTVSDLVEDQVQKAVQALLTVNRDLASSVVLGDRQVNRRIRQIDYLSHAFIVRHAPSARHLRYASAVLRLDVALERIGDYAGAIGREIARLSGPPPGAVGRDIDLIANQARLTLSQALDAFHEGDAAAARVAYGMADQTDLTLETAVTELLRAAEKEKATLRDIFGFLRIVNLLKRVAEQAENISEQTIFVLTGEEPDPKVFRVLFVDERNDVVSQLAEAYARKAYPDSGSYESAGWNPATELSPSLIQFLDERGMDVKPVRPERLHALDKAAEHHHVIVIFGPDARERLGVVPFRSTVVEWDLASPREDLQALYEEIAIRVQDLMTTLAGPDAR
jgi:phosphate transport system protein